MGQVGVRGTSGTRRRGSSDLSGTSGTRRRGSSDLRWTSGTRTRGLSTWTIPLVPNGTTRPWIFPACSAKKSKLFLSMRLKHFCEAHPPQVIPFLFRSFCFVWTLLPVWVRESWSARKLITLEGWVILPVKSHWTMNISANFCQTAKSFGWLLNDLFRSSLNSPSETAAEQHAYCSRGKINFWSHLIEERPENLHKFQRTPSRGRIESIKSVGKRSQKVT